MGGERSSTTRKRLAGKICCFCGRYLDTTLWQPPGERACDSCAAQRAPAPKLRRIHMSFVLRECFLVAVGKGTFHTMVPGCSGDGKEITEQHPSKLKPVQADGLFILYTSC